MVKQSPDITLTPQQLEGVLEGFAFRMALEDKSKTLQRCERDVAKVAAWLEQSGDRWEPGFDDEFFAAALQLVTTAERLAGLLRAGLASRGIEQP
jgi:hypothetical protein